MPIMSCNEDGKKGYRWGEKGKCYTYSPNDEAGRKAAKKKAINQALAITGGTMTEEETQEAKISDAPWSDVDKSNLPKSAFLWIEGDGKTKAQWHLPYKDASGAVNLGALRAMAAAMAGARTGKPMNVPDEVKAKMEKMLKKHKIGDYAKKENVIEAEVKEAEIALGQTVFMDRVNRRNPWVGECRG